MLELSRRNLLAAAAGAAMAALCPPAFADEKPLRQRAKEKGLAYGTATTTGYLKIPDYAPVLIQQAGVLVPEWEGKRGAIEKHRGGRDTRAFDRICDFAYGHGMLARGHAMVWHLNNAGWLDAALKEKPADPTLLSEYISDMGRRYRGRVQSWDVVNEAIEPDHGRPDGLRKSQWLSAFGPEYIDQSYHLARAADPGAMLVYNDYGCENADPWGKKRQKAVLSLLEGFRARGVPCDALGLQTHMKAYTMTFDENQFSRFLSEVSGMGYKILITEMDVLDSKGPDPSVQVRDQAVADMTRRVLDVALANPATRDVITWGLTDRYTYLVPGPWKGDASPSRARPLPLDTDLKKKPMWHAIARAFDGCPARGGG